MLGRFVIIDLDGNLKGSKARVAQAESKAKKTTTKKEKKQEAPTTFLAAQLDEEGELRSEAELLKAIVVDGAKGLLPSIAKGQLTTLEAELAKEVEEEGRKRLLDEKSMSETVMGKTLWDPWESALHVVSAAQAEYRYRWCPADADPAAEAVVDGVLGRMEKMTAFEWYLCTRGQGDLFSRSKLELIHATIYDDEELIGLHCALKGEQPQFGPGHTAKVVIERTFRPKAQESRRFDAARAVYYDTDDLHTLYLPGFACETCGGTESDGTAAPMDTSSSNASTEAGPCTECRGRGTRLRRKSDDPSRPAELHPTWVCPTCVGKERVKARRRQQEPMKQEGTPAPKAHGKEAKADGKADLDAKAMDTQEGTLAPKVHGKEAKADGKADPNAKAMDTSASTCGTCHGVGAILQREGEATGDEATTLLEKKAERESLLHGAFYLVRDGRLRGFWARLQGVRDGAGSACARADRVDEADVCWLGNQEVADYLQLIGWKAPPGTPGPADEVAAFEALWEQKVWPLLQDGYRPTNVPVVRSWARLGADYQRDQEKNAGSKDASMKEASAAKTIAICLPDSDAMMALVPPAQPPGRKAQLALLSTLAVDKEDQAHQNRADGSEILYFKRIRPESQKKKKNDPKHPLEEHRLRPITPEAKAWLGFLRKQKGEGPPRKRVAIQLKPGRRGHKRISAFTVMGQAARTAFDQEQAIEVSLEVVRRRKNDKDKVPQEWCHLHGHGDGGREVRANFAGGSKHSNTEQLSIESVQRRRKFVIGLKVSAYVVRPPGPAAKGTTSPASAESKGQESKGEARPMAIDTKSSAAGLVADWTRYRLYKGDTFADRVFDHLFDAQSESFDKNEVKILGEVVRRVVRGSEPPPPKSGKSGKSVAMDSNSNSSLPPILVSKTAQDARVLPDGALPMRTDTDSKTGQQEAGKEVKGQAGGKGAKPPPKHDAQWMRWVSWCIGRLSYLQWTHGSYVKALKLPALPGSAKRKGGDVEEGEAPSANRPKTGKKKKEKEKAKEKAKEMDVVLEPET